MFAALLDTCVLWPSLQRDLLLSLAVENLYRPLWSSMILEELQEHEALKLELHHPVAEAAAKAERLIATMRANFDDAEVPDWEPYEGTFGLPDPDDEHVLAAALTGKAGAIVTHNLKDFPESMTRGIQVLLPRDFVANTVAIAPDRAIRAVRTIGERRRSPAMSVEDILQVLRERYDMIEAVNILVDAL